MASDKSSPNGTAKTNTPTRNQQQPPSSTTATVTPPPVTPATTQVVVTTTPPSNVALVTPTIASVTPPPATPATTQVVVTITPPSNVALVTPTTATVTPPPATPATFKVVSTTPPSTAGFVTPTRATAAEDGNAVIQRGGTITPKRATIAAGENSSAQKKKRNRTVHHEGGSSSVKTGLEGKDGETPAPCWVCKRQFGSWKALFGHMRCHPDRQWRGVFPPPAFNAEDGFSPVQGEKTNHHHQQHQIVLEVDNTNSVNDLPATLLELAKGCLKKIDEAGPSSGPKRIVFDFDLNLTWEPTESPTLSVSSPPSPPPPSSPRSPTPPPPPGHGLDLDLNKSPPKEE